MNSDLSSTLADAPVVPLVQSNLPDEAVAIAEALVAGGLTVVEVVMRTPRAAECLKAISESVPGAIPGAGTVLNPGQAETAMAAGARFVVSPGLDEGVVAATVDAGLPIFPGIATASELQRAFNLGLTTVKFFPASIAGGVPALKAFASVFGKMRFMPTGGVSAANLADYLAVPAVLACGGSWLTPADSIANGDYGQISVLAEEALAIAQAARQSS